MILLNVPQKLQSLVGPQQEKLVTKKTSKKPNTSEKDNRKDGLRPAKEPAGLPLWPQIFRSERFRFEKKAAEHHVPEG